MSAIQVVSFPEPQQIVVEDQVRADFYALLAHLFYRAPDIRLLQAIALLPGIAGEGSEDLVSSWQALATAAALIPEEAVREEYQTLFIGVGRPPVMLYGSFYLAGFMMEKPLADLRADLIRLGFQRNSAVTEPEDHLAALCDVMRAMILGSLAVLPADVERQREFFLRHLQPWAVACCDAVIAHQQANFYRRVAAFSKAFFALEAHAFEF